MTEGEVPESEGTKKRGWWKRRSKKAKVAIGLLVLVVIIAAASSGGGGKSSSTNDAATTESGSISDAPEATTTAAARNDGPLVSGTWNGDCNQFSAGDLDACRALRVSNVTCQWQDEHVHMSVTFKNTFGAHVTVHMNPKYKLHNAGLHGDGLTSTQDVGLDPGELRTYELDQSPKGVSGQPAITLCQPGVDVLQGVELG